MSGTSLAQLDNKVVVVEDDVDLALLLRYNLEASGHSVVCFSDGAAAWRCLATQRPDAVVLDWGLPSLAGIEVLRRMRLSEMLRDVPVLMLTARCEPEDRRRAFETGTNALLAKPFSISELVLALDRLMAMTGPASSMELAGPV